MKIKTWFVTGASSGVGREVCKQLIDRSYNVIAVSRTVPEFNSDRALCLSVDVTKPETIKKAISLGIEKFHSIDVLMNNAGISSYRTLEEISDEEIREVMETNFFGALNTMKLILPHFRSNRNGTIINNTSQAGLSPRSYGSAYCSSKYALEGLTSVIWHESRSFCRVMAVELGFFPGTDIAKNLPTEITLIKEYKDISPFYKRYKKNFINNLPIAVKHVIDAVEKDNLPRRLMLGKEALFQIKSEIDSIKKDLISSRNRAYECSKELSPNFLKTLLTKFQSFIIRK